MNIIDTYAAILDAYEGSAFSFEKWKAYMDSLLPGAADLFIADAKACLDTGNVSWEEDFLPVLNAVMRHGALRETAHTAFCRVTKNLDRTIDEKFGRSLDVDLIFHLGLCSGAGWVTEYHGKAVVFLGIEKIMELGWCTPDDMRGLIFHELGHVYQGQYGILERRFDNRADSFLWQLFTEGIAMVFEQILAGDTDYYHQDKNGWKRWCDGHLEEIKADFSRDLESMSFADQRYFGDWVSYRGHGDVGYYLGCQFVRYVLSMHEFDEIIRFDIDDVTRLFKQFVDCNQFFD